MNRWSSGSLTVIFAFVIVFLAGVASFSVRAAFHSQSDRITGITFFVTVVCLVFAFERIFPSVYSGSVRRPIPWCETRAGFAVAFVIIGIIISILASRVATIWFGLTSIASALVALLLRARGDGAL
jgi:biotin transporter BioY